MSGTKAGGLKARETNLRKHGTDFYKNIGAKGGRNGHTGGFAADPELAKAAGAKGGRASKRKKNFTEDEFNDLKSKIEELKNNGSSLKDIRNELGVCDNTIKKVLQCNSFINFYPNYNKNNKE